MPYPRLTFTLHFLPGTSEAEITQVIEQLNQLCADSLASPTSGLIDFSPAVDTTDDFDPC